MTGKQFWECIERTGLSPHGLSDRWGVSHTVIYDEAKKDEVRGLYRSAVLWTLHELDKETPSSCLGEGGA